MQVTFNYGLVNGLPAQAKEGALYFCKDEAIYMGLADGQFHRFGDFIPVANIAALPESAHQKALYYAIAENVLCRWDGSAWVKINQDTNTTYELVAGSSAGSVKLIGKNKAGEQVSSVELQVVDVEAITGQIAKTQGDVDALKAKVGEVPEGSETVVEYIDKKTAGIASDEALTAMGNRVSTVEGKTTTLEGQTEQLDKDVKAAQKAADDEAARAKGVEEEIKNSIGAVKAGKTVVEMIADAQTAATYDDTQIKADIAKNKGDIAAIVADYLKASDKTELTAAIATAKEEVIAAIMGEAGIDEKYDTLKEIADWILADTTNSAALVAKVDGIYNDYLKGADKAELEGKINAVNTLVGSIPEGATSTTVVEYIKEVVDALKIGDYAKAADLTALAGRVATVEATCAGLGALATKDQVSEADVEAELLAKINKAHTHANADVLAGITASLVEQWNDAHSKAHTHENADELAKIAAGDKAKWDAMEQNAKDYAKDYADGAVTAALEWQTF